MRNVDQSYAMWSTILKNIKDDPFLSYSVSIDALNRWKKNGESLKTATKIISKESYMSSKILQGFTIALLEYQVKNSLNEETFLKLRNLIEKRIYDDGELDSLKWVSNILLMMKRQFTQNNFNWLLTMVIHNERPYPDKYKNLFIETLSKYIQNNHGNWDVKYNIEKERKNIKKILITNLLKKKIEKSVFNNKKTDLGLLIVLSKYLTISNRIRIHLLKYRIFFNKFIIDISSSWKYYFTFVSATMVFPIFIGSQFLGDINGQYFLPVLYFLFSFICVHIIRKKIGAETDVEGWES